MLAFALATCGFSHALRAGLSHQACGKTCRRHASAIAYDNWLCELRELRMNELKDRLSAAGVNTAGMFEKEDLVTALLAVQPSAPPPFFEAALREEDGGLYTSVKNGQDETLRLLVDTGAARSVLSSRHHGSVAAAELDCPSLGLTGLDCAVADLPSDVDGILGFDALRGFAATELDLSSCRLRLHNRAYSATHDGGRRAVSGREGTSRVEMQVQRVGEHDLPCISFALQGRGGLIGGGGGGRCVVQALVGTGTPITMVTPELAAAAALPTAPVAAAVVDSGAGRSILTAKHCQRSEEHTSELQSPI